MSAKCSEYSSVRKRGDDHVPPDDELLDDKMLDGSRRRYHAVAVLLWVVVIVVRWVDCETSTSPSTSPSPSPTVNAKSQSLLEKTIITSYVSFHRANRHTAPRLIYRYKGTQPGFGNRISNLLTAFTLASLSRRILIIDWREPYDLFTFYDPLLNLKYSAEDEDGAEKECGSVACKASLLAAVLPQRHRSIVYPNGLLHARLGMVMGMLRKHKDLAASKALKDVLNDRFNEARFFEKMFKSMVIPGKELSHLMSVHSSDLNKPFIAVHARLGAGLHEYGPRWGEMTQGGLASCFARHAKEIGNEMNVRRVYLATDTKSFRPIFKRAVKENGCEVLEVGKVEPVHTRDCGTHPRGCLQAVFEFMVLSRARGIVASRSTFSQVAAFVGGIEDTTIIKTSECR